MQSISNLLFFFVILAFLFTNCNETESKKECTFGEPVPIFKSTNEAVRKTTFQKNGRQGIEEVLFKNGISLELIQDGCDEVKQDFSFKLPPSNAAQPDTFWVEKGSQLLRYLSKTDLTLTQFGQWAGMIDQNKALFKLGEAQEVQPNYFITVDKINSPNETIVKVTLMGR